MVTTMVTMMRIATEVLITTVIVDIVLITITTIVIVKTMNQTIGKYNIKYLRQ